MSKRINADVLAELAMAAAKTARTHIAAADYLLTRKFWPEAYAIAAVGFEEAGKAWLAAQEILSPEELREQVPLDLGRDHIGKLRAAYTMLMIVRYITGYGDVPPDAMAVLARVDKLASKAHAARQRGLFADVRNGAVRSPADVREDEARAMVSEVKEVLDTGGTLIDMSTLMWAAGEKGYQPDAARSALAQAAQAVRAGRPAVEEFIRTGRLADIERRAEAVQSDPDFLRRTHESRLFERLLRTAAPDASTEPQVGY
jgi:AbiV family abortive infection protein